MKASRTRLATLVGATFLLAATAPAQAQETLIGFTDDSAIVAFSHLSDTGFNWAVQWSQTVASQGVTVSAIISSSVGPASANWWITTALGPAASPADVLFSGTYAATTLTFDQAVDFDTAPRTVLATGLNFAPGTYYLVLDGPPGPDAANAEWIGGGRR